MVCIARPGGGTINKTQMVKALASTPKEQERLREDIDRILILIADTLAQGENVHIREFGRFEPRPHKATTRRNPSTGEAVPVPPKIGIGFVPSETLKEYVNKHSNAEHQASDRP